MEVFEKLPRGLAGGDEKRVVHAQREQKAEELVRALPARARPARDSPPELCPFEAGRVRGRLQGRE